MDDRSVDGALRRLDEAVARRTAVSGEWATSAITAAVMDWAIDHARKAHVSK